MEPQSNTGLQKGQRLAALTQEMGFCLSWDCEEQEANNARALDLGKVPEEELSQGVCRGQLEGRRIWSPWQTVA